VVSSQSVTGQLPTNFGISENFLKFFLKKFLFKSAKFGTEKLLFRANLAANLKFSAAIIFSVRNFYLLSENCNFLPCLLFNLQLFLLLTLY